MRPDRHEREDGDFEERPIPPGLEARPDEPPVPTDVDERELPRAVRAELRGLSKERAGEVIAHLIAAGSLVDEDPELAFRHALAARRRAARLPVVREATAETAYAAGEYATALNEYRALRRMTGSTDYIAVLADCERALGRPQAGLRLIHEARDAREPISAEQQVELLLVEAGCRSDLGQGDEALRLLRNAALHARGPASALARLRYAYADLLEQTGDLAQAKAWFTRAEESDTEGLLDAAERIDALDGVVIEVEFDDEDEFDEHGDESDQDDQPVEEDQPVDEDERVDEDEPIDEDEPEERGEQQ